MATNQLYPAGKQNLLSGTIALSGGADTVTYCSLVSSSYTYGSGHIYYDTSVAVHQVGATGTLANRSISAGLFSADDITFTSVAAGSTVQHVVVFQSGAAGVSDLLVAYFDTGSAGGISISTNDGDITVDWNASGIFTL